MRAALNLLWIMSVVWFTASVQTGISKQIIGWDTIICCLDVHGIHKTDTTDAVDVPPFFQRITGFQKIILNLPASCD